MGRKYKHTFQQKESGYWRYHFSFKGVRYYNPPGGFPTEEQAGIAALEHKGRLQAEFRLAGRISTTFFDISRKYLDSLWNSETPINTDGIKNKAKAAADFLAFLGSPYVEINEISTERVRSYLESRPNNDSFNRYRTSLNQIFDYAIYDLRITTFNPVTMIKKRKPRRKKTICPTLTEVLKIIEAAEDGFPFKKNARYQNIRSDEKDLILTVIHSMARYGEVLDLRWSDVLFEEKVLIKKTRKTEDQDEKDIPVPMNTTLLRVLQRRWDERLQDDWVFWNHKTKKPYLRRPKLMKKLCRAAGLIRQIEFHGLRHFVTTVLANEPDVVLVAVQDLLGHEDIKTTQGYARGLESSHFTAAQILHKKLNPDDRNIF